MTIGRLSCALFTLTLGATLLWGQSDTTQTQDDANRNVPPAAYGQENPPMVVNENPPISGLDRPSLEPQIQPRSMLLGGWICGSSEGRSSPEMGGFSLTTIGGFSCP